MSLQNNFVHTGNWLFRYRSYLPLGFGVVLLAGMRGYHHFADPAVDLAWSALCVLVAFAGLGVRIVTIGHTPARTSGRNTAGQIAEVLNTTGIYSTVRHPLYVGNFLMWLGIALFPHSFWLAVVFTLAYFLYYERIMFAEEDFLRQRFGDQFEAWSSRTPAIFLNPRKWTTPSLPFSLRNVLKREYSGFFALATIFPALAILGEYEIAQHFVLAWGWAAFFAIGAITYVLLRTLKRHTRLLHVEGR